MSSQNKARLGFIGAGWWATSNHMPVFAARDDVELTAVCRLGQAELAEVRDHFGFAFATEDYRELLAAGQLDGVVVASPHPLHYEHARAALEAGLHVMCEKPLTTRAAHARELVRLAAERDRHLLVPYGWHHKPFIQRAKALMDEQAIGEVEFALCHMASPIRALLSGQEVDVSDISGQDSTSLFGPTPSTWADPAIAEGGYAHAQISHSSGLLFLAVRAARRARLCRHECARVRGGAVRRADGALYFGSHRHGQRRRQCAYRPDLSGRCAPVWLGRAWLLVDCERARMHLRRHDGHHVVEEVADDAGAYQCDGPPNNFADLILGKTDVNWTPGEAAMRGVEMLDAAYRSAASGQQEQV